GAEDRIVALDDVLVVRIPPLATHQRGLVKIVGLAIVERQADTPAVPDVDLLLGGGRPRRGLPAGVARRRPRVPPPRWPGRPPGAKATAGGAASRCRRPAVPRPRER